MSPHCPLDYHLRYIPWNIHRASHRICTQLGCALFCRADSKFAPIQWGPWHIGCNRHFMRIDRCPWQHVNITRKLLSLSLKVVLQNVAIPGYFPYILFYRYILSLLSSGLFAIAVCGSVSVRDLVKSLEYRCLVAVSNKKSRRLFKTDPLQERMVSQKGLWRNILIMVRYTCSTM